MKRNLRPGPLASDGENAAQPGTLADGSLSWVEKTKHVPLRTCVGCRTKHPRSHLVRLVFDASTRRAAVDERGGAPGRGAWIHPQCLALAVKKRALARAFRTSQAVDATEVANTLRKVRDGEGGASQTRGKAEKAMGTR